MGEAIAIAERKPEQVPTVRVNQWVWGKRRPSFKRQELIAELLEASVDDVFPPLPPRKRPEQELTLLANAAKSKSAVPQANAAVNHLKRAAAQKPLPSSSSSSRPENVCYDNQRGQKGRRKRRAPSKAA